MTIFSYESKFSQIMLRLSYGCYLNLLWFVFSLPILTCGAATSALYAVSLSIARGQEGNLTTQFIGAFRRDFRQATVLWLVILLIVALLGTDIYVLTHLRDHATGPMAVILTLALALVIVACVALAVVLVYVFPLVSQVENTSWAMLKNSFLIGTHYLFCTICVLVIHAAMLFAIIALFTPLIVLGEGVCAVLSSYLLSPVIRACTTDHRAQLPDEGGSQAS